MKKILKISIVIILLILVGFFINYNIHTTTKINNIPSNRETYKSESGFEFKYPKIFSGNVWSPTVWPAEVTVVSQDKDPIIIACPDIKNNANPLEKVQGKTSNGLNYLLYRVSDIGAGSLYSTYCYVIKGPNNFYVLNFTIRSHSGCGDGNCGAYCGTPFEQECKNLDRVKDIENPIKEIVSSFTLIE